MTQAPLFGSAFSSVA